MNEFHAVESQDPPCASAHHAVVNMLYRDSGVLRAAASELHADSSDLREAARRPGVHRSDLPGAEDECCGEARLGAIPKNTRRSA